MKNVAVLLLVTVVVASSRPAHASDSVVYSQTADAFLQDPYEIDLPAEAITRATEIVGTEEKDSKRKHRFHVIHDFLAPVDFWTFAKKGDRVWIVRVSGYKTKDGGRAFRFLWIKASDGTFVWEP